MNLSVQTAKHFRDVHFGGNWTCVNLKEALDGLSWEQATTRIEPLHTIATLVYHINYYVSAVLKVLQGEPLQASDKYSFDLPPITSEADWQRLVNKALTEAEAFATLVEQLPEAQLQEHFTDEKYGSNFRNLYGIVEHTHYHLGQISLIKKLLQSKAIAG